ncbi:DNA-binding protein [Paracoccus stylophorae]|uniref:DNA-binding protein n=1 Tax=Paracoccus stylophorae TaxID=659350 RepID=A0ABY7SXB1_9RHOB|nr:PPC domain-containing DNA-binding protein [Paracoccus stylophorae]WCR11037.1 DNA-binding protein [Paracoccus stylophorae]
MKMQKLESDREKTWVVALDDGDEAVKSLLTFARQNDVTAARFTALGAFSSVTLGFFDFGRKDYQRIPINEQVEVASLIGDFAVAHDGVKLHAHVVVAKKDGTAHGGHLLEGHVHPTLEVLLTESPDHLRRRTDPDTGLALLALAKT